MAASIRPRRSVLFLPGSNPRALEKARALPVDGLIFDLEDAVAPEIKDTARGPVSVDRWGNPVQNIYVRKVERVGGKLQNTVIATIPSVGQFYKFNPDEYMKLPLYSRDYPPCKAC